MSYMLSIATKNGIVLAAESRGNFYNEQQTPVAYYDTVEKIFRINEKLGLATTNNEFIGGRLFSFVLKEFTRLEGERCDVSNILDKLFGFLTERFPEDTGLLRNQQFIICGYEEDGLIRICKDSRGAFVNKGFSVIQSTIPPTVQIPLDTQSMTQKKVVKLVKRIIKDYAQNGVYGDRIPAWQRVGGPIDILWIPKSKKFRARWLRKKKSYELEGTCSFLEWAKTTRRVKLVGGFGKEELQRIITKLEKQ